MATRFKKKIITNVTLEQAQEASEQYAVTCNRLSKIEAKMNEEINKVKSRYQDDITDLSETLEEPKTVLEAFANEQKEAWGKKKSFELLHCIIGFRTSTPKVVKDKKFTWDAVTELVGKMFPNLVRTKKELDKESIIGLRDSKDFERVKEKCYIDVVQDETFFAVPKEEEVAV
jgi:phage host-nuclease inhibitor protein Gam